MGCVLSRNHPRNAFTVCQYTTRDDQTFRLLRLMSCCLLKSLNYHLYKHLGSKKKPIDTPLIYSRLLLAHIHNMYACQYVNRKSSPQLTFGFFASGDRNPIETLQFLKCDFE